MIVNVDLVIFVIGYCVVLVIFFAPVLVRESYREWHKRRNAKNHAPEALEDQ